MLLSLGLDGCDLSHVDTSSVATYIEQLINKRPISFCSTSFQIPSSVPSAKEMYFRSFTFRSVVGFALAGMGQAGEPLTISSEQVRR